MMWTLFVLLWSGILMSGAVEIPNGISGQPEVECGETSIIVNFNTIDEFEGRSYVVGHSSDPACNTDGVDGARGRRTTFIAVDKNTCSVTSLRSDNPPGLFVTVKVMITFHPQGFITKVDRGYEISCFYMEVNKTVTYPLTVSMPDLIPRTELAEMPRCRYEVFDTIGSPATVVSVGDPLTHKWTCESVTPSLWCMTVHSCYVEDGQGQRTEILSEEGCALDRYLLGNLEYETNLMAMREAHAFKYADRVIINYQCSIRLDIKEGNCQRPRCPTLRTRRGVGIPTVKETDPSEFLFELPPVAEVDVRTTQIDVLDPQLDFGLPRTDLRYRSAVDRATKRTEENHPESQSACVSAQALLLSSTVAAALLTSTIISTALLWRSNKRLKGLSLDQQ